MKYNLNYNRNCFEIEPFSEEFEESQIYLYRFLHDTYYNIHIHFDDLKADMLSCFTLKELQLILKGCFPLRFYPRGIKLLEIMNQRKSVKNIMCYTYFENGDYELQIRLDLLLIILITQNNLFLKIKKTPSLTDEHGFTFRNVIEVLKADSQKINLDYFLEVEGKFKFLE